MKLPGLLLALSLTSTAQAQSAVLTTDTLLLTPRRSVDGQLIQPFSARYTMLMRREGQEKPVGSVATSYEYLTRPQQGLALKRSVISFPTGTIVDSGTVDRRTLYPRAHRSHQPNSRTLTLDFAGARVTGFNQVGPQRTAVDLTTPAALFDSFSADLVVLALPLRAGQPFKFAQYVYEKGGQDWVRGRIVGAQPLPAPDGKSSRPAWVVQTFGADKSTVTYWLDAPTRRLLQVEFVRPGRELIMRLAE
ncbi:DUF3108 domain-containing protein [Hymenobacter chitinivorans]|uniref:DUF3108 domain-containing protein n=1 Tax=Hymenobacter chitinivorans DSM 11115 TaxID=1121954 RepID=A0A2M9BLQ7_9BACT|nr:hypothetical protein [Hymenobacter chitinivorans]PJJ58855.1 hypothetical protein CLV45_0266 [Hymenobacter chitinivorans DSM 11115]